MDCKYSNNHALVTPKANWGYKKTFLSCCQLCVQKWFPNWLKKTKSRKVFGVTWEMLLYPPSLGLLDLPQCTLLPTVYSDLLG